MRNDANSCRDDDPSVTPKVADACLRFSTVSNKSRRLQQVPGWKCNTGLFHWFVWLALYLFSLIFFGGSFSPQDTGGSLSSSSLRPAVRIRSGLQSLDFFSTLDTFSFEPWMPMPCESLCYPPRKLVICNDHDDLQQFWRKYVVRCVPGSIVVDIRDRWRSLNGH